MVKKKKKLKATKPDIPINSSQLPIKMLKKVHKMAKISNSTRTKRGSPKSSHYFYYTLWKMDMQHILRPHKSERYTLYLLNFNRTGTLMNTGKILSLTQECGRCHWPDKYEDIPRLHRRHLSSQLKQGVSWSQELTRVKTGRYKI